MEINWSAENNEMLKGERGLDLANIADSIREGDVLEVALIQTSFPGDPGFTYLDEEEKALIEGI